ncbi:hypothetical protein MINTM005_13000 [Mycobacterium intracellulare]|nr:hypothetical protein MINTM005_13000 [Mycobacterium intracellulare]
MEALTQNTREIPQQHLPVDQLIQLMQESDEPWRFEDLILWRATELEDPKAIAWVCSQVQGHG